MADKTTSERFGKRVKHKHKKHFVGGGLFGGVREVGTSYEVEPLPEHMVEEPKEPEQEITHREAIRKLKKNYGLPTKPNVENEGFSAPAYIQEVKNDIWNKGLCPHCERKQSKQACKIFLDSLIDQLMDYAEPCCPNCGEWVESFQTTNIMTNVLNADKLEDNELSPVEETYEQKEKVEPCGCLLKKRHYFFQAKVPENKSTKDQRISNLEE